MHEQAASAPSATLVHVQHAALRGARTGKSAMVEGMRATGSLRDGRARCRRRRGNAQLRGFSFLALRVQEASCREQIRLRTLISHTDGENLSLRRTCRAGGAGRFHAKATAMHRLSLLQVAGRQGPRSGSEIYVYCFYKQSTRKYSVSYRRVHVQMRARDPDVPSCAGRLRHFLIPRAAADGIFLCDLHTWLVFVAGYVAGWLSSC